MGYRRAPSAASRIDAGRKPLHPGLISYVRHNPAKLRQPRPRPPRTSCALPPNPVSLQASWKCSRPIRCGRIAVQPISSDNPGRGRVPASAHRGGGDWIQPTPRICLGIPIGQVKGNTTKPSSAPTGQKSLRTLTQQTGRRSCPLRLERYWPVVFLLTKFSESLCSKDRGGTSRNALDLAFSVQRLSENSVSGQYCHLHHAAVARSCRSGCAILDSSAQSRPVWPRSAWLDHRLSVSAPSAICSSRCLCCGIAIACTRLVQRASRSPVPSPTLDVGGAYGRISIRFSQSSGSMP